MCWSPRALSSSPPSRELSLWDMAALAPIVTEAGGRFTGLDGVDGVHSGNAAASNGLLHEDLLDAIGDRSSTA